MFDIRILNYEFASPGDLGLHSSVPTITFRGAFGYALAQVIARAGCIPSLKSQVELYRRIFMPANDEGSGLSRNQDLARPFALRGFYSRPDGHSFILQILLFGIAAEHEIFFDHVAEVMSYMGIGRENRPCHFEKLGSSRVTPAEPDPCGELLVNFITPCCRMKSDGRVYEEYIPFHVLLPRLVDRIVELDNIYGSGDLEDRWDIGEMKRNSRFIAGEVIDGGVSRSRRVSGRTGQEMSISGFSGRILYTGDFTPFLAPLGFLPHINIGRFNVFGCGWCSMRCPPPE